MIKFLLISFFIVAAVDVNAQQYWLKQSSPTNRELRGLFFTDTLKGWIGGDSGLVLYTTNGGTNWTVQNTGVNDRIVSMFFISNVTGFALAWEVDNTPPNYYGTRILETTNGGTSWSNYLYPDSNLFLTTVYYLDSLHGYMVGTGGTLLSTSDAGSNWINGIIDSGLVLGFPVEDVKFYDYDFGIAVGGAFDIAGVVWRTSNGGRNWRTQIVGPEPMNALHMFDSVNMIAAGGDFEYGSSTIRSTDAGGEWHYTELGVFGIANALSFRNAKEAWISLGIVDSFLVSTNAGANWRLVGTPSQSKIYNLLFVDQRNGWAVGNEGVILKFNSDLINVSNNNILLPESFILHQNYPNPFNPVTVIGYELRITNYVTLKIYDVLGNEAAELVNNKQDAGKYSVEFNGSNLPSGIYFYRIEAFDLSSGESQVSSKKMMILK